MGYTAGFRAPGKQPKIDREREKKRKKDTGTKTLMEQRCFNQHGMGIYTVFSAKIKIKIPDLENTRQSILKREEGLITIKRN